MPGSSFLPLQRKADQPGRWRFLLLLALCSATFAGAAERHYDVLFRARLLPEQGIAQAEIEISQPRALLKELRFSAAPPRYRALGADGRLERSAKGFTWIPPKKGGLLRYEFRVERSRGSSYDARMTGDWALLRIGHLFPPAAARTVAGARSRSSFLINAPAGWQVETPFGRHDSQPFAFSDPERGFDRPTGWMMAGRFGIRRQIVAGRGVAVVAPLDSDYRRMDILAMLNWNLPILIEVFPAFPERLLIVGAADPMWRGGLSGPGSLYLHADRPLISENGTSTLLHELVHVATRLSAARDDDWIVEGLAEYYGIEIMRRSGTVTEPRFQRSLAYLRDWAAKKKKPGFRAEHSKGANTAAAVILLYRLDQEIRQASEDRRNLDAVARLLAEQPHKVSFERLKQAARTVLGHESTVLETVVL